MNVKGAYLLVGDDGGNGVQNEETGKTGTYEEDNMLIVGLWVAINADAKTLKPW